MTTPPSSLGAHPTEMLTWQRAAPDGSPVFCSRCGQSGTRAEMEELPCLAAPATALAGAGAVPQPPAATSPPPPVPAAPPPPSPTPAPPPASPTPPPPATPSSPAGRARGGALSTPAIVAVAASLGLGVSTVLDWASSGVSAFDIPLAYLWGDDAAGDLKIGIAVVGLAVIAAIAVFARWHSIVLRVVSTVAGLVAGAFVIQYATDLSDIGMSWSDVLGEVGIGVWVALVSAVVIGLAARLVRE